MATNEELAAEIVELRSQLGLVRVKSEPLTYRRDLPTTSYFRDLLVRDNDRQAMMRLEAHAREMAVEIPAREARAYQRAMAAGLEFRVNPNRTTGQGGYFAPPLWLNEQFATAPRPPRVLAGLLPHFDLPAGVQSINLPRLTTGVATGTEQDLQDDSSADLLDSAPIAPVTTISGQADVALQLLEQSPQGAHLDWVVMKDLSESYDAQLEAQVISGVSTTESFVGVLNVSSINTATYTSASPALVGMYPALGQASAAIGNKRKRPVEVWVMTTSRWSWMATSFDDQHRPLVTPSLEPPERSLDGYLEPVSSMLGWPVYVSDAVPVTLGAGSNQDVVIACRPSDMLLLEGDPRIMIGLDVLSGSLMARLQYRRYVAAFTGRYPTGISVVSGTGMVIQSNF